MSKSLRNCKKNLPAASRNCSLRSQIVAKQQMNDNSNPVVAVTIDDLPDEILVKILDFALLARGNVYTALPRVCSGWTRIVYRFVYVNGFVMPDYEGLLIEHLATFTRMVAESDYGVIVSQSMCENYMDRYRLAFHPRVVTYSLLRSGPRGCETAMYIVRSIRHYCHVPFNASYAQLNHSAGSGCCHVCSGVCVSTEAADCAGDRVYHQS